jgi:hypothetical protein
MGATLSRYYRIDIQFDNRIESPTNNDGFAEDNSNMIELGRRESCPLLAGSLLRGKVILTIPQNQLKSMVDVPEYLQLRFYGKEKVHMNRRRSQKEYGNDPSKRAKRSAERPIVDLKLHWRDFPNVRRKDNSNNNYASDTDGGKWGIPAGTYIFPFSIPIPITLPSSTYYPTNDNRKRSKMRFRIQYKMTATLQVSPGASGAVQTTRYVWIRAARFQDEEPREKIPCVLEPVAHEIISSGFFSKKGTFLFAAAVEDCRITNENNSNVPIDDGTAARENNSSGSGIDLHIACRNDSNIDVSNVIIKVLEKLTWGTTAAAAANQHIDKRTGAVRSITTLKQTDTNTLYVLNNVKFPGLARKERVSVLKSIFHGIVGTNSTSSIIQQLQRQIYEDIRSGENLIHINLPQGHDQHKVLQQLVTREDYSGQLIQIEHLLRIEFQMGGGYFRKNPVVEIPIYVLPQACIARRSNEPAQPCGAEDAYQLPEQLTPATTGFATGDEITGSASSKLRIQQPVASYDAEAVGECLSQHLRPEPDIPMATARPMDLPDDAFVAFVNDSSENVIVLGGDAILKRKENILRQKRASAISAGNTQNPSLQDLVPMTPPASVELLLSEMRTSINDYEIVAENLMDERWTEVFQDLTPEQFGSILACVHVAFDQPRVALLLAPYLSRGGGLTCEYIVEAIRNTTDHHRAMVLQKLLPHCTDASINHNLIRSELNEWETTLVNTVLEEAIQRTGH